MRLIASYGRAKARNT